MRWFLRLMPVVVFAAFAVALALGLQNDPTRIPSVLIGKPMPSFALAPVEAGSPPFTTADLKGHVSLVNVFGSWCAVCVEEQPMLMALAAQQKVPLYGIDWKDAPVDGARWLRQYGNPFKRTGNDEIGRTAIDLGVTGAPETFVVDRQGRIRYKQIGAITDAVWRTRLAPLIAQLEAER